MYELIIEYLHLIVPAILGVSFLAGKFIMAKRVANQLALVVQSFEKGDRDKVWKAEEYEDFGRKAVPLAKDLKLVLGGLLPTKTKI